MFSHVSSTSGWLILHIPGIRAGVRVGGLDPTDVSNEEFVFRKWCLFAEGRVSGGPGRGGTDGSLSMNGATTSRGNGQDAHRK